MTTVTVKVLGEMGRLLGWEDKEVQFEGATLECLLKSIPAPDGNRLYDLLIEQHGLKSEYVISVNGKVFTSLETPLVPGDRIATMEVVRLFHGG
jgi:hypothetical protein